MTTRRTPEQRRNALEMHIARARPALPEEQGQDTTHPLLYLNEYSFRYNRRDQEQPMFEAFLGQVVARK